MSLESVDPLPGASHGRRRGAKITKSYHHYRHAAVVAGNQQHHGYFGCGCPRNRHTASFLEIVVV